MTEKELFTMVGIREYIKRGMDWTRNYSKQRYGQQGSGRQI